MSKSLTQVEFTSQLRGLVSCYFCWVQDLDLKFNRPVLVGREREYVEEALQSTWMSGDGHFSRRVQGWMSEELGLEALPTTSCTDALEMTALLANVGAEDEVIVPSFTFVSTALAFAMRGCRLVFADSDPRFPHVGWAQIEPCLTPQTKVVVVVDYAGSGHDLDLIEKECAKRGLLLVEDAAQGIGARHGQENRRLGSFGDAATFSFHETKNLHCGEGGALILNRAEWKARASVLWEKGTNRKAFFQGLVDKYGWVDLGSSFLPNEMTMAFLLGQLERLDAVNGERLDLWSAYNRAFSSMEEEGRIVRQVHPPNGDHNGHMYYVLLPSIQDRSRVISALKSEGIHPAFHYQSLHRSRFIEERQPGTKSPCPESDRFSDTLLRLPLHLGMKASDCERVSDAVYRAL